MAEVRLAGVEGYSLARFLISSWAAASPGRRAALSLFAAVLFFASCWGAARAEDEGLAADGPAILTVTGTITRANRGPLDPASDLFFIHHNLSLGRAMRFSREALLRLPQQTARAKVLKLEEADYSGPLLRDVLKEAGAAGAALRIVGLDGYAADFTLDELAKKDWILALSRDGRPLGVGDLGPLWLMRALAPGEPPDVSESEHWVWAAFYIEIQ